MEVEGAKHIQPYYYQVDGTPGTTTAGIRDSCSDTDSGICADSSSDTQLSPKRVDGSRGSPEHCPSPPSRLPPGHPGYRLLPSYPLCSPSRSSPWKLRKGTGYTSTTASSDVSSSSDTTTTKRLQPLRVRFADEVAAATSHVQCYGNRLPAKSTKNGAISSYYYSVPNGGGGERGEGRIATEDNYGKRSLPSPPPPPYFAACDRIRTLNLKGKRESPNCELSNFSNLGSRSASLPRVNYIRGPDEFDDDVDEDYTEIVRQKTADYVSVVGAAKSMENLSLKHKHAKQIETREKREMPVITGRNHYNPCVMPSGSFDDIVHLSSDVLPSPNHKLPRTKWGHGLPRQPRQPDPGLVKSVRNGSDGNLHLRRAEPQSLDSSDSGSTGDKIRVRLLGLDNRGIQVLEIEKLEPGPFGFYIATGFYRKKKGIFVSRVNEEALGAVIAVGDQILCIDSQPVRGKTLEQVQAMIANKMKIVLKMLPIVQR